MPSSSLVRVAQTIEGLLGQSVSLDQPLMEAGLDSLAAVELRNALSTAFSIQLPVAFVFDHPTAAAMAAFLDAQTPAASTMNANQPMQQVLPGRAQIRHEVSEIFAVDCCYPGNKLGECSCRYALFLAVCQKLLVAACANDIMHATHVLELHAEPCDLRITNQPSN